MPSVGGYDAELVLTARSHFIRLRFDEAIHLGTGEIIVESGNVSDRKSFDIVRIPALSDPDISLVENEVHLYLWRECGANEEGCAAGLPADENTEYTVSLTNGALIDRGGNSVSSSEFSAGK